MLNTKNEVKINKNGALSKAAMENLLALAGGDKELLIKGLDGGNDEALDKLVKVIRENAGDEAATPEKKLTGKVNVLKAEFTEKHGNLRLTFLTKGRRPRTVVYEWDGKAARPFIKVLSGRALKPYTRKDGTQLTYEDIGAYAMRLLTHAMEQEGIKVEDIAKHRAEAEVSNNPNEL